MDAPFTGSVFLGMSVDGFIARLDDDLSFLTAGSDSTTPDDGEGGDFGFATFVSGLDAPTAGALVRDLRAALRGRVVVCVTHDELEQPGDTVVRLGSAVPATA